MRWQAANFINREPFFVVHYFSPDGLAARADGWGGDEASLRRVRPKRRLASTMPTVAPLMPVLFCTVPSLLLFLVGGRRLVASGGWENIALSTSCRDDASSRSFMFLPASDAKITRYIMQPSHIMDRHTRMPSIHVSPLEPEAEPGGVSTSSTWRGHQDSWLEDLVSFGICTPNPQLARISLGISTSIPCFSFLHTPQYAEAAIDAVLFHMSACEDQFWPWDWYLFWHIDVMNGAISTSETP